MDGGRFVSGGTFIAGVFRLMVLTPAVKLTVLQDLSGSCTGRTAVQLAAYCLCLCSWQLPTATAAHHCASCGGNSMFAACYETTVEQVWNCDLCVRADWHSLG